MTFESPARTLVVCFVTACAVAAQGSGMSFRYVEVGAQRGILPYDMVLEGMGAGVAAADFDNDGDIDVFVPNGAGTPDQLYRNTGSGRFEEVAAEYGVASIEGNRCALWFDYDGDHRLDLLVANDVVGAESSYRLYRQTGRGFEDVTFEAGLLLPLPAGIDQPVYAHRGGLCAGDINNDGYLDFMAAFWNAESQLFVNNGNGTFTDISRSSGIFEAFHYAHQPVMADFNGDGLIDVYLAVDFLWNSLFINQGDLAFVDIAPEAQADNAMNDMGVTLGDFDNDGDLDIFITNIAVPLLYNVLLRNDTLDGNVLFTEVAPHAGVARAGWAWGTTFFDADLDGWLDVAVTNGWITPLFLEDQSRLFLSNRDGATFTDVSTPSGFDDTLWGSSLIAFDVDRDGDLDLMQTVKFGPLRLLENRRRRDFRDDGPGYLVVKPRMGGSNHFAIGATVHIEAGGTSQMRLLTAGTSYLGQEPAEAHFGVGNAQVIDTIRIDWPAGGSTIVRDVEPNQVITVERGN